ncbi:MAG: pyridoxal-phosphate dependent enzyme [Myxococcota bacterium]|nr:pyridoxal-phosphate dependent enzyme [Myxococcota bacterium]
MTYPLTSVWPKLESRLERVALGEFPTPLERSPVLEAELGSPVFLKRDDLSSPVYGGNKVRTLETLFGAALARGQREIVAVGAYGSNHAVASALHAPRVGLRSASILFPQPHSLAALENLRVSIAQTPRVSFAPHWSFIPPAIWLARRAGREVMAPGGATPVGALGYVSAGLELGLDFQRLGFEPPRWVYVGIGSTCTTAGLLVGLWHAARLGLGFRSPPTLVAVRVTPWPVTSRFRVLSLAVRTSRLLAELAGDSSLALEGRDLSAGLTIDSSELGAGYGKPTERGLSAIEWFRRHQGFLLDTTYSAKSAAAFLRAARDRSDAPCVFWSTKSTAPLPDAAFEARELPSRVRRWLSVAGALERRGSAA